MPTRQRRATRRSCAGSGTDRLDTGRQRDAVSARRWPATRFIGGSLKARATRIDCGRWKTSAVGPVLQQLAGVQHRGVAAEQQRFGRLGGGVDHGRLAAGEQLRELLAQLLAQLVVQVHQRLVEQHQRRLLGQRARQRHALLLAARELGRQALQEGLDVQLGGQLGDTRLDATGVCSPRSFSGEAMLSATVIDG